MIRSRSVNVVIVLAGTAVAGWALVLVGQVLARGNPDRLWGLVPVLLVAGAALWAAVGAFRNLRRPGLLPSTAGLPTERWAGWLLTAIVLFGLTAMVAEDLASPLAARFFGWALGGALVAVPLLLLLHLGLRLGRRRRR